MTVSDRFRFSRYPTPLLATLLAACQLDPTAATPASTAEAIDTGPCATTSIDSHTAVCDTAGNLLSWAPVASPDHAFDYVLRLNNQWYSTRPAVSATDRNGQNARSLAPWYSVSYLCSGVAPGCSPAGQPVGWPTNGAGLAEMMTESGLRLRTYNGDASLFTLATDFLTHHLTYALSPSTDSWSRVPFTDGTPGEYDFHGDANTTNGVGDGAGYLEPEKVAALGYAYALAFEANGNTAFRDAAVHIANQVYAHQRQTGLTATVSPWPFRTRSVDNVVRAQAGENYASNVVDPLLLYTEVIKLGSAGALAAAAEYSAGALSNWQTGKASALGWLLGASGPIQDVDHNWCEYFEDVAAQSTVSNLNQLVPMETAKYLMDHPGDDPSWQTHVSQLLAFVDSEFGDTRVDGARPIREQNAFMYPMGSHTSRFAAVHARYFELTGATASRDEAFRAFNWATYMVHSNGLTIDGPAVQNLWFSDGWADFERHFFIGMAAVPDWAPSGENHLLRSTSVVTSVTYATTQVHYQTYDPAAREVLRLGFTPTSVTAGGVALTPGANLATSQGWTWDTTTDAFGNPRNVLRVRHDNNGTLVVQGSTTAPAVAFTAPTAGANFAAPASPTLRVTVTPSTGRTIPAGGVAFYNGATLLCTATQTASPYSCVPGTGLTDGTYSITARATDNTGEVGVSSVGFSVSAAPTVNITSPTSGSTVPTGTVALSAHALAGSGRSIAQVVFKSGTTTLCTATTSPYSCLWTGATAGSYSLTATATDTGTPASNTVSSAVAVTVSGTAMPAVILGTNPSPVPTASDFEDPQVTDYWQMVASASGAPTTLNLYLDGGNAATTVALGVYTSSAGAAATLLTSCTATVTAGQAGWASCAASPAATLTSGTTYWFAVLGPTASHSVHWREQSGTGSTYSHTASGRTSLTATAAAVTGTYPGSGIAAYAGTSGGSSAPTVVFTSPANNANFAAPANPALVASATPGSGRTITRVEFFQAGTTAAVCTVNNPTSTSVSCGLTLSDGAYSYTARATDDLAQATTSGALALTVSNAPVVAITSPANGASVTAGNVALTASATAGTGRTVHQVVFRQGTTTVCTATVSPWTCTWTGATAGTYSLTAMATDNAASPLSTTSAPVSITVTATATAPTAPSSLVATAVSSSRIDLGWTDASNNETGFKIERAPDNAGVAGTFAQIATTAANVATYSNTALTAGTRYWYRVRATNGVGDSTYSNTSSATTQTAGGTTTLVGYNAIASVGDSSPQGEIEAFRYTAAATGTLAKLLLYVRTASSTSVRVGLYSNTGTAPGVPGSLLGTCTLAAPTAAAWNSCTLATGVAVTSGTTYWLAMLSTAGGDVTFFNQGGPAFGTDSYGSSSSGLTALPATFPVGTGYGSFGASFYGTN